jgi:hypothetical protein
MEEEGYVSRRVATDQRFRIQVWEGGREQRWNLGFMRVAGQEVG